MDTVMLQPLFHRGTECIGIFSPQNATLNYYFQRKAGAKWSRTHKCWYIPCTEKNYEQLTKALAGKATLQIDELKKYLLEKKRNTKAANVQLPLPVIPTVKKPTQKPVIQNIKQPVSISKENKEALEKLTQQLILKSYSTSTIKTYTNEFVQFLQPIQKVPAGEFTVQRIKDYLQYCHVTLRLRSCLKMN